MLQYLSGNIQDYVDIVDYVQYVEKRPQAAIYSFKISVKKKDMPTLCPSKILI